MNIVEEVTKISNNGIEPNNVETTADVLMVNHIATLMSVRLSQKRAKGYHGWWNKKVCSIEHLENGFVAAIEKRDWINVLNYAAMLAVREETKL